MQRIPAKFVRKFGDELSDVATLRGPNGCVWHVKLLKDGKKIWFHDGWPDFVKYHSICAGYFLVFKYEKNSDLNVLVFDKTACEVQYSHNHEELESDEQNSLLQDEMKTGNSVEKIGLRTPNEPLSPLKRTYKIVERGTSLESERIKHPNDLDSSTQDKLEEEVERHCKFCGNNSATKRRATNEERERVIEAAEAFEPANPFCWVVLCPTYVQRRGVMYLPSGFSAQHLEGVSGYIELQLSDGKQWPVCVYERGRARLSQGWKKFIFENNLKDGEVCVFEVLRLKNIVLKVTVFRILDNAGSMNRQSFVSALDEHEFLALLKDMEIFVKRRFGGNIAEVQERAINMARSLKPRGPSFTVILQSTSTDNASLYVPTEFAGKYLSRNAKIIKLQVSDGRVWLVQLMWRHNGVVNITRGWPEFLNENNLEKGDMCLFELTRTEDILLKVYFNQCSANQSDNAL